MLLAIIYCFLFRLGSLIRGIKVYVQIRSHIIIGVWIRTFKGDNFICFISKKMVIKFNFQYVERETSEHLITEIVSDLMTVCIANYMYS